MSSSIGSHILRYLQERDSDTPLSREQIVKRLSDEEGLSITPREVQSEINSLNAELKLSNSLIVSIPGRPGYWIPKADKRELDLLLHAERTFGAHKDAASERESEIRALRYYLETQLNKPSFDARGQAVMFAQV